MPETPTNNDLQRQVDQLQAVVDRDRNEMRKEMRDGFSRVEAAIGSLNFVPREVYELATSKLDGEMRMLDRKVGDLASEVSTLRKVFIGSFLALIAAGVVMAVLVG